MAGIGQQIASGAGTGGLVGGLLGASEYAINENAYNKQAANRPQYQIPAEVQQGLSYAENNALEGLPEEQKQQFVSNLQRGASYSLGQTQSRKGGLQGIAALNENQNTSYGGLMASDAAARYERQKNVYGQLSNVADHKSMQFQVNQLNPFLQKQEYDAAQRGAAEQNINSGISSGISGALSIAAAVA